MNNIPSSNPVNDDNKAISLLKLILLGYIGAYLISENQCRYGYIICWLFMLLGMHGFKGYLTMKSSVKVSINNNISFNN